MFDKYQVGPSRVDVHQNVTKTVTEKRAPTDESVKLLREMEAAAEAQVTDRWLARAGDNQIGMVAAQRWFEDTAWLLDYKINGQKLRSTIPDHGAPNTREFLEQAIKVVAEDLARMLIVDAAQRMKFMRMT